MGPIVTPIGLPMCSSILGRETLQTFFAAVTLQIVIELKIVAYWCQLTSGNLYVTTNLLITPYFLAISDDGKTGSNYL